MGALVSPFLLLDYGPPHLYSPTSKPRGVGDHPHRGFETVTIAFSGEVSHRDSAGGGGTIGPGDVQWMTAGSGIVHQEFHSPAFSQTGGTMHMAQLWVNLPSRCKMMAPTYQAIAKDDIPVLTLPNGGGSLRLIAGAYQGQQGPARTQTPMWVWDLHLQAGAAFDLPVPMGWSTALVVMAGQVRINGSHTAGAAQLTVLGHEGEGATVHAGADSHILVLAGQPIDEPIVGYGPFVMNTREEIITAFQDFNEGRFGTVPA
jgi:redox-sensitive bicupin YhaK (pirin superfamily)